MKYSHRYPRKSLARGFSFSLTVSSALFFLSSTGCSGLDSVNPDAQPGQQQPQPGQPQPEDKVQPSPDSNFDPEPETEKVEGDFETPDPAGVPGSNGDEKDEGWPEDGGDGWPGGGGTSGGDMPEDEGDSEKDSDESGDDEGDGDSGGDPGAILKEADVVHMDGDIAYVLSEFSGLHILNLADPANIQVLGHKQLEGAPFEMYVRGSSVVVMVRERHFFDDATKDWRRGSVIVRLNASNPAQIQVVDQARILGRISDSRMEGDRLYVVSYENGYCFDCDNEPKIRLSSLMAKDGAAVSKVDEAVFAPGRHLYRPPSAYFGPRQVIIAGQASLKIGQKGQLHRAMINWDSGDLKPLEPIVVDGRVQSRWQMNQKDDVLRVFSQGQRRDIEPKLETFRLEDEKATALAGIDVKLPEPEDIKSARFDGDRAYLITFRRTDPLFTFDLSDPASPKQMGELEIPGWVYHMEPRGDRLLGIGYNVQDRENRLSLTLFDVSQLAKPTVLSRLSFGGPSADFAEGQDQIHKSIKILEDKNLVLVPYGSQRFEEGGDGDEDEGMPSSGGLADLRQDDCGPSYSGAIQLFDWSKSDLKLRGTALLAGGAHRSFLHKDRLIALSDSEISAFNIDDRDKPVRLSHKEIAMNANRLLVLGEHSVRVSNGWQGQGKRLEVVRTKDLDKTGSVSFISLGELEKGGCEDGRDVRVDELFAHGDNVYVSYRDWYTPYRRQKIAVVNLKDVTAPKVLGSVEVAHGRQKPTFSLGQVRVRSRTFGAVGDRVVVSAVTRDWDEEKQGPVLSSVFSVLRIDPVKGLVQEVALDRKDTRYAGGIVPAGQELGSWHARKTDKPGVLKFYYDRFYIDADGRFRHQAINVPGAPLGRDSVHGRLLTMNFSMEAHDLDPVACKAHIKYHAWDWEKSKCVLLKTGLAQVELPAGAPAKKLSEESLSGDAHKQQLAFLHEDRVFATAIHPEKGVGGLRVVAGLDAAGVLRQARADIPGPIGSIVNLNGPAVLERNNSREMRVLDGSTLGALTQQSYNAPMRWCQWPVIRDNDLLCAMGRFGIRRVEPK